MRRSHRKVWLEPESFPKEMLLTGPKFHLNTTSGSGVTLKKYFRNKYLRFTTLFANICSENIDKMIPLKKNSVQFLRQTFVL